MNKQQAIEILTEMQKWRRGIEPYDDFGTINPYTPEEYGEALDYAIDALREK